MRERGNGTGGGATRTRRLRLVAAAGLSLLAALALAELSLHVFPRWIPSSYRDTFLGHGVEFFRPGTLARTPIEGLPLPLIYEAHDGPLPADLVEMGMVSPEVGLDRALFPRAIAQVDARGLPNARALDHADVLFVGDSFTVASSFREPEGLRARFEEASGKTVYVLALAGIGPVREAWLLEEVGLGLAPELVLWFFFGGNDVVDARVLQDRRDAGALTYADFEEYRPPPRLILPALVASLGTAPARPRRPPLPGLRLPGPDGTSRPIWFLPRHLFMLTMPAERLAGHRGWSPTAASLVRAHRRTMEVGARFVLVYLPSKAQVYLPLVERDPELVHRMLTFDGGELPASPEALLDEMLANRGELERLVRGLCEREGIAFFSATPHLGALAERGGLGFLTSDTHWSVAGQESVVGPLYEFLRTGGFLTEGG